MYPLSIPNSFNFTPARTQQRAVGVRSAYASMRLHRSSTPKPTEGFTLIETLATLTIFSIVMALLSTSLFQAARLAEMSERQTVQSRDEVVRLAWLKTSINAGVADWIGGKNTFRGSSRNISGMTTRALSDQLPGRTAFDWRLVYNPSTAMTELRYQEVSAEEGNTGSREDILIHAWLGNIGSFSFLQENGTFTDSWSGNADPKLGIPALPVGVLLQYGEIAQSAFVTIADRSPRTLRAKDI